MMTRDEIQKELKTCESKLAVAQLYIGVLQDHHELSDTLSEVEYVEASLYDIGKELVKQIAEEYGMTCSEGEG